MFMFSLRKMKKGITRRGTLFRRVKITSLASDETCIFAIIRKTCPCNEYPHIPHFYMVKMGNAGVYLFFLFLLQNIDCGYSLEPQK